MSLVTGSALGNITSQNSDVFVEGAPWIYYQDYNADPLFNPDGDGFYWGMSGTSTYPAYSLACYEDVTMSEDLTVNAIRCDKSGDTGVIQKRNHLEFSITLSTLFPLTTIQAVLKASAVTTSAPFEKMGLGDVDNNAFYRVYLPKVYDEDAGDYVAITLHKAQFVNAFNIAMQSGDRWQIGGISIWAFAHDSLPNAQKFATIVRYDPSLIT